MSDLVGKHAKIVKYEPFTNRKLHPKVEKGKIYEILRYLDGLNGKYYLFRENRAGLADWAIYEAEIEFEAVEIEENVFS